MFTTFLSNPQTCLIYSGQNFESNLREIQARCVISVRWFAMTRITNIKTSTARSAMIKCYWNKVTVPQTYGTSYTLIKVNCLTGCIRRHHQEMMVPRKTRVQAILIHIWTWNPHWGRTQRSLKNRSNQWLHKMDLGSWQKFKKIGEKRQKKWWS